jgi:hypothetical protein
MGGMRNRYKGQRSKGERFSPWTLCPVSGKIRYPDYATALLALDQHANDVLGVSRLIGSVYQCSSCGSYHHTKKQELWYRRRGRGKRKRRLAEKPRV